MKTKEKKNTMCSVPKDTKDIKTHVSKKKKVTEKEIESEVDRINPDENSMESRG